MEPRGTLMETHLRHSAQDISPRDRLSSVSRSRTRRSSCPASEDPPGRVGIVEGVNGESDGRSWLRGAIKSWAACVRTRWRRRWRSSAADSGSVSPCIDCRILSDNLGPRRRGYSTGGDILSYVREHLLSRNHLQVIHNSYQQSNGNFSL